MTKNGFIFKRKASEAVFVFVALSLTLYPLESQAGFFSFIHFPQTEIVYAQGLLKDPNSQTMSLLSATTGMQVAFAPSTDVMIDGNALDPSTGPLGTAADVEDLPPTDQITLYVVRPGDSIGQIADMFNVSVNTIKWANNIQKGGTIHAGQELLILPISGVKYVVKKGDTLAKIAKAYNGDSGDIALFNGITDENLTVGTEIIIPDGEIAAPAPAKTPTKKGSSSSSTVSTAGFMRPVRGTVTQWAHDHYRAVDIGAPTGTTVVAAGSGRVIAARMGWNGAYGNMVIIDHGNGVQTLYAHLSAISVSSGQTVSEGQEIGRVGQSGHATGPHLHFETRGKTALATSLYKGAPSVAVVHKKKK